MPAGPSPSDPRVIINYCCFAKGQVITLSLKHYRYPIDPPKKAKTKTKKQKTPNRQQKIFCLILIKNKEGDLI